MPWVKPHVRNGSKVKGHFRLNSRFAFIVGFILLLLFFAVIHKKDLPREGEIRPTPATTPRR